MLILIPVWKRPEITEICFLGLDRLRAHCDLEVLAVISEDSYKSRCIKHDIRYTFFENYPLGAKKKHGLKEGRKLEWDYLVELNSDNLIKNELLDIYDQDDSDFIGLRNFCFMNSETKEVRQICSNTVFGIARRYSRQAIESAGEVMTVEISETVVADMRGLEENNSYDLPLHIANDLINSDRAVKVSEGIKLWDDLASAGMDNYSKHILKKSGFEAKQIFTEEPLAVDIKSEVNIWKWNPEAGVPYPYEDLIDGLSDKEIECLEQL